MTNGSRANRRSEDKKPRCRGVPSAGGAVALAFPGRPSPTPCLGLPVLDGDATDLRFLDPPGAVVGLTAKGTARRDDTGFVVDAGTTCHPLRVVG